MRLEVQANKKLVHESTLPIRWGDMDAMGHVNNAMYFRYMEVARVEWLHSVGGAPNPDGSGPVIVNAFCNFTRQLEFPGTILVKQFIANPGRTSFDTFNTMERLDTPGFIHASGGATVVWVNFREQKPTALPDWLQALLAS